MQKLARHNLPLFLTVAGSLAGAVIFFALCVISGLTSMSFGALMAYLALAMIFGGVFIGSVSILLFSPKGILAKNESKHLERQDLDELTEEELNALIDFHRSQKNFDAADSASKYLMLKVENNETE